MLFQFALFLFIGVLLACFYSTVPSQLELDKADEIYPHFIVNYFPKNTGLVGLMLAAILAAAMSTLSSSLNASASAVVHDFYLPSRGDRANPAALLWTSRWLCVGFGMLQIAIGVAASLLPKDSTVVSNALTIAGFSAGVLLGLFMLGVLTTQVNQRDALWGAGLGLLSLLGIVPVAHNLPDRTRQHQHQLVSH